jgi:CRISPR/Cas system-associated endonuclease/helicase Cas3
MVKGMTILNGIHSRFFLKRRNKKVKSIPKQTHIPVE